MRDKNIHVPILVGGIGEINYGKQYRDGNMVYNSEGISVAIKSSPVGNLGGQTNIYLIKDKENDIMDTKYTYRIRKLTPKECWRLMDIAGKDDENFEKAEKVNSNTQLYKQAGNAIVRSVLMGIFSQFGIKGIRKWNDMSNEEIRSMILYNSIKNA